MKILILNGPNLNLLGKREPEIYGHISFEEYLPQLRKRFSQHELSYFQSNHEGVLIDKLQEADGQYDAVVMNPGAYAHTSIAIADCIRAIGIPVIEVHISDISKREPNCHIVLQGMLPFAETGPVAQSATDSVFSFAPHYNCGNH